MKNVYLSIEPLEQTVSHGSAGPGERWKGHTQAPGCHWSGICQSPQGPAQCPPWCQEASKGSHRALCREQGESAEAVAGPEMETGLLVCSQVTTERIKLGMSPFLPLTFCSRYLVSVNLQ